MSKIVTARQALKALLRARTANEKGFGRYRAYLTSPDSERGKLAEQRAHHWLDQEERQLGIIERFIRQYLGD
ncbi:hypothetical protein [Sphingomonas adhaesiva]|uniref:hypothetical protein n=1 Tax=Sphingomonas adhaesiva TaxID=28212 RepID=UPI002FF5680E